MIEATTIIEMVSAYFKVAKSALTGKRRYREYVLPRYVCFHLIRKNTKLTFKQIAKVMRSKDLPALDHSTVLHGVYTLKNLMETDPKIEMTVNDLQVMIDEYNEKFLIEMEMQLKKRREDIIKRKLRDGIFKVSLLKDEMKKQIEKPRREETLSEHEKLLNKYA